MTSKPKINDQVVSQQDFELVQKFVAKVFPEKLSLLKDGDFSLFEVMDTFNRYNPYQDNKITDGDFFSQGFNMQNLGAFRDVKKILAAAGVPTDYDSRCDLSKRANPKDVPVSECELEEAIERWPDLTKVHIVTHQRVIDQVRKAIIHIESNKFDKVDVYGELDKKCFSYHFHLVLDNDSSFQYMRGLDTKGDQAAQKIAYAEKMIDQKKGVFLYHLDEHANRYPVNSGNRNMVQTYDGKFHHINAPICDGSLSDSHLGGQSLTQFDFAIIPKDHPLFKSAIPLNDGTSRRFLVWHQDRFR